MGETPEGVDLERLAPWFAEHVPGATGAPLTAELIAGGRSNLTYAVSDGSRTWVLRRPPLGHVVETAHDMGREYRVIAGLADTGVPVPRVDAFCDDPDVNGAPFYVMERVEGRILRTPEEMAVLTPEDARRVSNELIDVLARLHWRRLRRRRARRVRTARRLPRPQRRPVGQAVAGQQDA